MLKRFESLIDQSKPMFKAHGEYITHAIHFKSKAGLENYLRSLSFTIVGIQQDTKDPDGVRFLPIALADDGFLLALGDCPISYEQEIHSKTVEVGGRCILGIASLSVKIEHLTAEQGKAALESRKNDAEVVSLNEEGCQLMSEEKFESARNKLMKAIQINPRYATGKLNIGASFFLQERWHEAIPWIEQALEMDPQIEGAESSLEQCYKHIKRDMASNLTTDNNSDKKKWWQFWK